MRFFVQLLAQQLTGFKWHSASRSPSATVELFLWWLRLRAV